MEEADHELLDEKPDNKQNQHFHNNRLSILVVEDNDDNFEFINEVLTQRKNNIVRASNGKEAVELAKKEEFEMILMDLKMPELDGYEATRQIRLFNQEIPIIAITANAFYSDQEKAIKAGCDEFIPKPIDFDKLVQIVGKYSNLQAN
jgi:CheY-like chemotaxis protein